MLQGVACGSGKLYLCFWVTKLVAVSVYKQSQHLSNLVKIAHHQIIIIKTYFFGGVALKSHIENKRI